MACTPVTLSGLSLSCGTNFGGISKIYLTDIQNVSSVTISGDTTVSAIAMVDGTKFKEYSLRKNLSNFNETFNNEDSGAKFVDAVITAVFTKQDAATRAEIEKLVSAQLLAIVLDANGNYRLVGYSEGNLTSYLYASAVGTSGTQAADPNQFTVTLTSQQATLSYYLQSGVIDTVI